MPPILKFQLNFMHIVGQKKKETRGKKMSNRPDQKSDANNWKKTQFDLTSGLSSFTAAAAK